MITPRQINSFNKSIDEGELSSFQQQVIITLINKKKDQMLIENDYHFGLYYYMSLCPLKKSNIFLRQSGWKKKDTVHSKFLNLYD